MQFKPTLFWFLFFAAGASGWSQAAPKPPSAPMPPMSHVRAQIRAAIHNAELANKLRFITDRLQFLGGCRAIQNKPYSAIAVTRSVQTLADGNRIVHQSSSQVARDRAGRTRRQMGLPALGPWATAAPRLKSVLIRDPVSYRGYILQPGRKIAVEQPCSGPMTLDLHVHHNVFFQGQDQDFLTSGGMARQVMRVNRGPENQRKPYVVREDRVLYNGEETKVESLGERNFNGIPATGTRTVHTIPAGVIGNLKPITIVSEEWYSHPYHLLISSTHSDPRYGTHSYQLTHISTSNPPRSLFTVPPGYHVRRNDGGRRVILRLRRQLHPQPNPPPAP